MAPIKHEQRGPHGAASSTHYLGTSTAMAVLARGGNAFDAAVAAGFVLQVVEPHLCGPGGEVPAVFVTATDPTPRVLCGQGVAPAAATVPRLRDELGLEVVPGTGLLAATVPGAWDGWLTLLRDHGTMTLAEVLEPALGYAEHGFPLVPRVPPTIAAVADHFREHWPSSARTWLPDGRVPAGVHRLPVLAATWRRLLDAAAATGDRERGIEAARDAWYRGFVAEEVEAFCRQPVRDESGRDHAGLLTADDLAGWSACYEDALVVDAGEGWSVAKPAAWSQGPVLAQMLQLLRGSVHYADGVATAGTVHAAAEAAKLAFADREAWYGDSAPVPLTALTSPGYAAARRALIGDAASLELRPGSPDGRPPRLAEYAARPGAARGDGISSVGLGEPTVQRSGVTRGDTVHVDVVDAAGNMISATPSGGWLQSSPTIPALGFCLGTRAQMFLAAGRAAVLAGPGSAAADHAQPVTGAARRRAADRVRHPRRRPAGPVAAVLLPGPHRRWARPAGRDRRPGLALDRLPVVVRAARLGAGRAGRRVAAGRGDAGRAAPSRTRGRRCRAVGAGPAVRGRPGRRPDAAGGGRHPQRGGCRGGPVGLLQLDEQRVRLGVADVLPDVGLGRYPAGLVPGLVHLDGLPAHGEPPPEGAQRDDHHVRVAVLGGPVARPVAVLQHPHPVVLEDHGVELRVGADGIAVHGVPFVGLEYHEGQ
jgi:gamma-glutamyltranspeptidase/glutathione hydrolase